MTISVLAGTPAATREQALELPDTVPMDLIDENVVAAESPSSSTTPAESPPELWPSEQYVADEEAVQPISREGTMPLEPEAVQPISREGTMPLEPEAVWPISREGTIPLEPQLEPEPTPPESRRASEDREAGERSPTLESPRESERSEERRVGKECPV